MFANDSFGHWRHGLEEVVASARGDRGAAVLELLAPGPDDRFVLKSRHSAFHGTALATVLDELGARRLVLAGIAAEACVLATAFASHMRDCPVWVPRDCVGAIHPARVSATVSVLSAWGLATRRAGA